MNLWIFKYIGLQRFFTTKNSLLPVKVSYLISGCTVLYFGQKKKKSNCSVSVIRESSPRKLTRIKVPNQWPTGWKDHIMNKWPSMYRFRILWGKLCLGLSCVSCPSPPTHISLPRTPQFHCMLLNGLEFQPQTHRAVNWEKDATISFWGETHKSSVFSERQSYFCALENYIQSIA